MAEDNKGVGCKNFSLAMLCNNSTARNVTKLISPFPADVTTTTLKPHSVLWSWEVRVQPENEIHSKTNTGKEVKRTNRAKQFKIQCLPKRNSGFLLCF